MVVQAAVAENVASNNISKKLLGRYMDQYANLADNYLENLQGLTTLGNVGMLVFFAKINMNLVLVALILYCLVGIENK